MEIKKIGHDFSVCKVVDYSLVDFSKEFMFAGKLMKRLLLFALQVMCLPMQQRERMVGKHLEFRDFRFFVDRNFICNLGNFSRKLK